MTRVSENSNSHAVNYAVSKAKKQLEDLQIKGSNMTNISRPSDNPIANVETMSIINNSSDNKQYLRNINFATLQLNTTDKVLEQISDLLLKVKDITIQQSSDFYDGNIRKNVSNEIKQVFNQILSVGNTRIGNKYIFGGHSTLNAPFDQYGDYLGDKGHIQLEVAKDFFVPINLNGHEIFYNADSYQSSNEGPLKALNLQMPLEIDKELVPAENNQKGRELASVETAEKKQSFNKENNLFGALSNLISALETNDSEIVQELLESFDSNISRLITLRTRVGSILNTIQLTQDSLESNNVNYAEQKSKIMDVDVAEVFSDIMKQQSVLKTTYQSSKALMNQTLLDFLK